jgi:hypothetical protein
MALTLKTHLLPMALRPSNRFSSRKVSVQCSDARSERVAFRHVVAHLPLRACLVSIGPGMCATCEYVVVPRFGQNAPLALRLCSRWSLILREYFGNHVGALDIGRGRREA